MTPLRLEIEGFTCFREPTLVELGDLEVDLFAIAGATGSGKSTLLDAMTYALYGQIARLGSRGLDVLISPGAEGLTVQLDFRSARGVYRVTRLAWHRPSGVARQTRLEHLQPDGSWQQLPESEKLKEADLKLIEIVGLDYDGFTRAVMLPQGAFDEFLRGDAGKRRKLLTALLGLDRVETMQKLAGQRSRDAEQKSKALITRLEEDYQGATPERRRQLADRQRELRQLRDEAETALTALEGQLVDLENLKTLVEQQAKLTAERDSLAAEEADMGSQRERLERGRRALLLAPQVQRLGELENALEATRKKDHEARNAATEAAEKDLQAMQQRDRASAELAARTPAIEQTLERLASIGTLEARLQRAGASLELASEAPAGGVDFDEGAWEEIVGLQAGWSELDRLQRWLAQNRGTDKALKRKADALNATVDRSTARLVQLEEDGLRRKHRAEEAALAYRQAASEDHAAALRQELKVGDRCPVCGKPIDRLEHHDDVDLAAFKDGMQEANNALETLRDVFREARDQAQKDQLQADSGRKELERTAVERGQLEADIAAATGPFQRAGLDSTDIRGALETRHRETLATMAATVMRATGGEEPEGLRRRLQSERKSLEEEAREAESTVAGARADRERQEAVRTMVTGRLAELESERNKVGDEVERGLATAGFASLEAVRTAVLSEADLGALEQRLNTFESRRGSLASRYRDLEERLAGRRYDGEAHQETRNRKSDTSNRRDGFQTAFGKISQELETLEGQLERAKGLREDLVLAQARFDTYKQLHLDLRGDRFQDFLMTQVQQRLALRASHIVREVTDRRYDLRLIDGDYHVLDAWSGGESRSARTLSGGETFIASLALALALSDTVAGSEALGALFLDEGFGTLDPETLDAVASVLEALTREGRMVGIVTHVRELSDRLPARLRVDKGPDGSSVAWDV